MKIYKIKKKGTKAKMSKQKTKVARDSHIINKSLLFLNATTIVRKIKNKTEKRTAKVYLNTEKGGM